MRNNQLREQLSIALWMKQASDDLLHTCQFTSFSIISLSLNYSKEEMFKRYCNEKKIDRRKKDDATIKKISSIEDFFEDAGSYVWKERKETGASLYKILYINLCVGFENWFKRMSVVANFANFSHAKPLDKIVFIPSKEFSNMREEISQKWQQRTKEKQPLEIKIQDFFEESFYSKDFVNFFDLKKPDYKTLASIFKIRNSLVHEFGYFNSDSNLELFGQKFIANSPIEINQKILFEIERMFSCIATQFDSELRI